MNHPTRRQAPSRTASRARASVVAFLAVAALAGCSGGSSDAMPTASSASSAGPTSSVQVTGPKTKVSLPPAAKKGTAPQLTSVSGFNYTSANSDLRSTVKDFVTQNRQIVNASTIGTLHQGSDSFGQIMAYSVVPSYLDNPIFEQQFLVTAVTAMADPGAQPTVRKVSSLTVAAAKGKVNVAAAFVGSSVIVVRSNSDVDQVVAFLTKYAKSSPTKGSGSRSGAESTTPPPSPVG